MSEENHAGYRIEVAVNNRAKCKGPKPCSGTVISEGQLRLGTAVNYKGHKSFSWRHYGCVSPRTWARVKKQRNQPSDLEGFLDLPAEMQVKVTKAFQNGRVDDEDISASARPARSISQRIAQLLAEDKASGINLQRLEERTLLLKDKIAQLNSSQGQRTRKRSAEESLEEEDPPKYKRNKIVHSDSESDEMLPLPPRRRLRMQGYYSLEAIRDDVEGSQNSSVHVSAAEPEDVVHEQLAHHSASQDHNVASVDLESEPTSTESAPRSQDAKEEVADTKIEDVPSDDRTSLSERMAEAYDKLSSHLHRLQDELRTGKMNVPNGIKLAKCLEASHNLLVPDSNETPQAEEPTTSSPSRDNEWQNMREELMNQLTAMLRAVERGVDWEDAGRLSKDLAQLN